MYLLAIPDYEGANQCFIDKLRHLIADERTTSVYNSLFHMIIATCNEMNCFYIRQAGFATDASKFIAIGFVCTAPAAPRGTPWLPAPWSLRTQLT